MTAKTPSAMAHASAHKLFSFRRTWAIATNTFRDLVRQKVFYFMVVFAMLLIGLSLVMVTMSYHGQLQTVMDMSFGAMSVFTMLLAVLSTAMLLPRDLEERTLYTILAKPVARFEYLLGKFGGVAIMLTIATVLMTVCFSAVLWYWQGREIANIEMSSPPERVPFLIDELKGGTFTPTVYGGVGVILLRAFVCSALTLMFSTFATSWLFTVVVSFVSILIGHLVPLARSVWMDPLQAGVEVPWYLSVFLRLISVICPDMQLFNVVDHIAVGTVLKSSMFLSVAGLAAGYLAIYILVSWLFFAWKEL